MGLCSFRCSIKCHVKCHYTSYQSFISSLHISSLHVALKEWTTTTRACWTNQNTRTRLTGSSLLEELLLVHSLFCMYLVTGFVLHDLSFKRLIFLHFYSAPSDSSPQPGRERSSVYMLKIALVLQPVLQILWKKTVHKTGGRIARLWQNANMYLCKSKCKSNNLEQMHQADAVVLSGSA